MTVLVPVMPSEAPGNYLTGALWGASVKALGDFVTNPPLFLAYQASAQSIPNNTFTAATLDTEVIDTLNGHSTVTNTSRYTFQCAGRYRVDACGVFTSNSTSFRAIKLLLNGGANAVIGSERSTNAVNGFDSTIFTSHIVTAAAGDYVENLIFQNSGGALSTHSNGSFEYVTFMAAQWISN